MEGKNIPLRDSMLIANKMMEYGLESDKSILEITECTSPSNSLSSIFSKRFAKKMFLLSRDFDKMDAFRSRIKGAEGRLYSPFGDVGIKIGKVVNNPNINEFDAVVVNGFSNDLTLLPGLKQDVFAGYVMDTNDKDLCELKHLYNIVYDFLNFKNRNGYVLIEEQYKRSNRELLLIAKKR